MAIVISHLHFYIPPLGNDDIFLNIESYVATCGLILFFFLSGYSLMLKKPEFKTLDDIKTYVKKRILKIYPLYWLIIIIAVILSTYGWTDKYMPEIFTWKMFVTILGFQIIFSTAFIETPVWFVSAILIFYLLFPILIYVSDKIPKSFFNSMSIASIAIFITLIAINLLTNEIDERVIQYYWFFIAGIILGREVDLSNITVIKSLPLTITSVIALPLATILPKPMSRYFVVFFFGMFTILMMIQFSKLIKKSLWNKFSRPISWIAPSTLSIYLFHDYILHFSAWVVEGISPSFIYFFVIIIGIPLGLFIPPFIQVTIDKVVNFVVAWTKTL